MASPAGSDTGPPVRWDEQRVELALAMVLRVGVLLAASLVLLGGVLYVISQGGTHPHYGQFSGEPGDLRSPSGVLAKAASLQPLGLIQLGVLLLIATPVLRVAFSLLAFARERDRTYVVLTAVVLAILLLSLLGVLP